MYQLPVICFISKIGSPNNDTVLHLVAKEAMYPWLFKGLNVCGWRSKISRNMAYALIPPFHIIIFDLIVGLPLISRIRSVLTKVSVDYNFGRITTEVNLKCLHTKWEDNSLQPATTVNIHQCHYLSLQCCKMF